MAAKKKTSPALIATAIHVIATTDSRCRVGYVFTNQEEKRIELDELTPEQIAAIEADPYLKVTYEADEELADGGLADNRILELENTLSEMEAEIAELNAYKVQSDKLLSDCQVQITELLEANDKKDAEIAELKATTAKPKK